VPRNNAEAPIERGARKKPSQKRSQVRYNVLVDAANALLVDNEATKVGLYAIAAEAGVPPASVYHLFPTKESVFVALAERYLIGLGEAIRAPFGSEQVGSWQDMILLEMQRALEYYNGNPVMCKLFLGENAIADVRRLDVRSVAVASASTYDRMNVYFEMPFVRAPEVKFATLVGIYDGIWITSYARHGCITEEFAHESGRAAIAYCRTFLPEELARRI
jgi:AcrR family transcriptional regulator